MKKPRSAHAPPSPEGPYEHEGNFVGGTLQKQDLNRFLDFVVALYDEGERIFGAQISQRDMRIVIELVRNHLSGVQEHQSSKPVAEQFRGGRRSGTCGVAREEGEYRS